MNINRNMIQAEGFKKFKMKDMIVPFIFIGLLIYGYFNSSQSVHTLANTSIQQGFGHLVLVLALLIPIRMGLGVNFGIIVGAIAGQLGVIIAMNMGTNGGSLLVSLIISTVFASILGVFVAICMQKAGHNATVVSLFLAYFMNGIYQYVALNIFGNTIPIQNKDLLLSGGTGLRNTISLQGLNNLPQVSFVFLLALYFFYAILRIVFSNHYGKSTTLSTNTLKKTMRSIIKPGLGFLVSILIMTMPLPYYIVIIKDIQVSLAVVIISIIAYGLVIMTTKVFTSDDPEQRKGLRADSIPLSKYIIIIVLSIVVASWGQILSVHTSKAFTTYGSHLGVGTTALLALIIGGARMKYTKLSHAVLGCFILQAFFVLWPDITQALFNSMQGSESLRIILMNGLIVYFFIGSEKTTHLREAQAG